MITTEFPIDLDNNQEGLGELFITDATLLVQPRKVLGQYPASVPHDTVHSYDILRLGNDMGEYTDRHLRGSRTGSRTTTARPERCAHTGERGLSASRWRPDPVRGRTCH